MPVVALAGWSLRAAIADPAAWQVVLMEGVTALLFYSAFLWLSRFAEARDLVLETFEETLPALAKRLQLGRDRSRGAAIRVSAGL